MAADECPFLLLHSRRLRRKSSAARACDVVSLPDASLFEVVEPASTPGLDYLLIVGRRYRLRVRREEDAAKYAGASLQMRLAFADDGTEVPGLDGAAGPLLQFVAPEAEYGEPARLVPVAFGPVGVSLGKFGIAASTYRHRAGSGERTFRLIAEPSGGGPAVAAMLVRTVTHLRSVRARAHCGEPSFAPTPAPSPGLATPSATPACGSRQSSPEASPRPPPGPPPPAFAAPRGGIVAPLDATALPPPAVPAGPSPAAAPPLEAAAVPPEPTFVPREAAGRADSSPEGSDESDAGGGDGAPSFLVVLVQQLLRFVGRGLPAERPKQIDLEDRTHEALVAMERLSLAGGGGTPSEAAATSPAAGGLATLAGPHADPPCELAPLSEPVPLHRLQPVPLRKLGPAYRHATPLDREEAVAAVRQAGADVALAAAAAGLQHPVSAEDAARCAAVRPREWLHLGACCRRLATALASPAVLDTTLIHTRDGVYCARRTMEDLRFVGSSELVEAVFESWREHILKAPLAYERREDAELLAEHVWGLLQIATGFNSIVAWMLLPVDREFVFALLDKADAVLGPYASPDPDRGDVLLFARRASARARALEQFRETDAAVAHYFEAWAALLRAGLSPSRQEVAIIRELVDIFLRVPDKVELGCQLCERMYWFCETDEDAFHHARCLQTLAMERQTRGRHREAQALLHRALALVAPLSPGYRVYACRLHQALATPSLMLLDLPALYRHVDRTMIALGEGFPPSANEMDVLYTPACRARSFYGGRFRPVGWRGLPSLVDIISGMRGALSSIALLSAGAKRAAVYVEGHSLYQIGIAEMNAGEYANALECFEKASATLYAKYPAYFPPHLPRVRHLERSMEECRARLAPPKSAATPPTPAAQPAPSQPAMLAPARPLPPASDAGPAPGRNRRPAPSWLYGFSLPRPAS